MKIRVDPLDTLFSEFIRKRAMQRVHGCERCLAWKPTYIDLQCSHYHKRRKQSVRFDEDNCIGICFGCHQYFEENRDEYTEWMIDYLGEQTFDLLKARTRQVYPRPDKKLLTLYYQEKIKELGNAENK